jgi:hypothetical protein
MCHHGDGQAGFKYGGGVPGSIVVRIDPTVSFFNIVLHCHLMIVQKHSFIVIVKIERDWFFLFIIT